MVASFIPVVELEYILMIEVMEDFNLRLGVTYFIEDFLATVLLD